MHVKPFAPRQLCLYKYPINFITGLKDADASQRENNHARETTSPDSPGGHSTVCVAVGECRYFTRLGLNYASPLALLSCRFSVALMVLLLIGSLRRRWLPVKEAGSVLL